MKKRKILFLASHRPGRAPGQRFRFEQYFDFLNANGFECELSYIITANDDAVLYQKGHYFQKYQIQRRSIQKRKNDLAHIDEFDIVFIFREALVTGSIRFEKLLSKSKAKLVFDFDDAIWNLDVSDANRLFRFLKRPSKTGEIIALCDLVFAGNQYLADYASKFNKQVTIVPTTIDTNEYKRVNVPRDSARITIGWSGSITTIKHFEFALPFLRELKKKYADRITIKVIGDGSYVNEELGIRGLPWKREDELKELSSFDIGIMPLPDDEWAKGKCGLKGLQYMALGIPTLMSPVGVNTDIIQDGLNGFLAVSTAEWVRKIELLMDSEGLRTSMGKAALETVETHYSVNTWQEKYLAHFRNLLA
jgi:glycosyltransferase involved in cell wall biosynthesis